MIVPAETSFALQYSTELKAIRCGHNLTQHLMYHNCSALKAVLGTKRCTKHMETLDKLVSKTTKACASHGDVTIACTYVRLCWLLSPQKLPQQILDQQVTSSITVMGADFLLINIGLSTRVNIAC